MSTRSNGRETSILKAPREGGHVVGMQRRRLLLAIGEIVGEDGLEAASVGSICRRAGVSRRTFYEIFDSREDCLLVAFDAAVQRIMQPVLAAWDGAGSWRVRIRSALVSLLEQLDAQPEVARMCIVETLKAGPSVFEHRARVLTALVAAVEQGRRESRPPHEPPPLTSEGIVGGALSVIHARLLAPPPAARNGPTPGSSAPDDPPRLSELTGSLMAMIVYPYLGSPAAHHELDQPAPSVPCTPVPSAKDPFKGLSIRFTYRTARVLSTIAADPGASNRLIANGAGVTDEGQISRLLTRLQRAGLIHNQSDGQTKGESNAWTLTQQGTTIQTTISQQT